MIRAVLFEPEGTLFEAGYGMERFFRAQARRWVDAAGRDRQDEFALARRLHELHAAGLRASDGLYARIVDEFRLPSRASVLMARERAEDWPRLARPLASAGLVLDRLARRGHLLGLVAEGGVREHAARLEQAGWSERFDTVLVSEAQGAERVGAQVLARASECLGLRAHEVACVAAERGGVLDAAREQGMHTVWLGADVSIGMARAELCLRRLDELVDALEGFEPVRAA